MYLQREELNGITEIVCFFFKAHVLQFIKPIIRQCLGTACFQKAIRCRSLLFLLHILYNFENNSLQIYYVVAKLLRLKELFGHSLK